MGSYLECIVSGIAALEVSHHFQEVLTMPEPQVPNDVVRYENQVPILN